MKNFWRNLLDNLPLIAAEGGICTETDSSDILKSFGEDAGRYEAALALVRELLEHAGALDPIRLADGKWRFVSYPARLFACSLISLFANGEGFFQRGFWAADMNALVAEQHKVLHALETIRIGTGENFPIRRTFVAWGIIKRGRQFILKRRENQEDDPDNSLHGRYGFPGGRVNMNDFDDRDGNFSEGGKLDFLYGIPRPITETERSAVNRALEHALVRELHEELGLKHNTHYSFSASVYEMPPETFIHGANAQHCVTECHITPFDISLTSEGDAFLASNLKPGDLFTLEEIISPWSDERKVFFNTSCEPLRKYLENRADSADSLRIRYSDLSADGTKPRKKDEPVTAILPLSTDEPLILGDTEVPINDPKYIELLLLLGFCARKFGANILSDVAEEKNWGWVKLDDGLRTLANNLNRDAAQSCGARILAVNGPLCRLRLDDENIFFSPRLFRAELKEGEITLIRRSLDYPGLFHLDSESFPTALSSSNQEHLQNILHGGYNLATYDNLRKLRTKSNQRLDDLVRQYGLYQLYRPINDSISKELQEFCFVIHVK